MQNIKTLLIPYFDPHQFEYPADRPVEDDVSAGLTLQLDRGLSYRQISVSEDQRRTSSNVIPGCWLSPGLCSRPSPVHSADTS